MRFVISQSVFAEAIATVNRVVPTRPTHPILGNFLLVADNGKLSITGFDLSIGIKLSVEADVLAAGSITVPAKLLTEIVSKLSGNITFEVVESEDDEKKLKQVCITHESGKYSIGGLDADEYPSLPTIDDVTPLTITVRTLQSGINAVVFAASNDETKQVLTGVHINSKDGEVEFAATDGHVLSALTIPKTEDSENLPDFKITLPSKACNELCRMLQKQDSGNTILMYCDDTQAVFEVEESRLTCRVLDGAYPAYRQLIPVQFSRKVSVDKRKLASAIDRVSVLSSKNNLVKFDISKDKIILSVDAQDFGTAREIVLVDLIGEDQTLGFNSAYLKQGLSHLTSPEIQVSFNESAQPAIFTPLNGDRMIFLCMPIQIVK